MRAAIISAFIAIGLLGTYAVLGQVIDQANIDSLSQDIEALDQRTKEIIEHEKQQNEGLLRTIQAMQSITDCLIEHRATGIAYAHGPLHAEEVTRACIAERMKHYSQQDIDYGTLTLSNNR